MRKTMPYKPSPYAGYELYVRDASGNILATYSGSIPNYTSEAQIKDVRVAMEETYIYGSSRIGVDTNSRNTINRGAIQYELTNHLGNVLAVVTGKKLRDAAHNYLPDLVSTQDYSPFGMQLEGRSWNSKEYRFGFQGQETENDMYGDGNASFYKYRISDNRLGRFFSIDPLAAKYPHNSPYAFSENRVIDGVELEGLEHYSINGNFISSTFQIYPPISERQAEGQRELAKAEAKGTLSSASIILFPVAVSYGTLGVLSMTAGSAATEHFITGDIDLVGVVMNVTPLKGASGFKNVVFEGVKIMGDAGVDLTLNKGLQYVGGPGEKNKKTTDAIVDVGKGVMLKGLEKVSANTSSSKGEEIFGNILMMLPAESTAQTIKDKDKNK